MPRSHSGSPTVSQLADGHSRKASAGDRRALSEKHLGTKEGVCSEKRTRLSVWRKDIRQEVARDVTKESETEVVPRRQNTLTGKAALRRRLRANRMSNDAATSGMSLPQLGTAETQTLPNYAATL